MLRHRGGGRRAARGARAEHSVLRAEHGGGVRPRGDRAVRRRIPQRANAGVATGHYARVTRDETTGRYLLRRGRDARKDQSDFLWPLNQSQLAAAQFPVGDLDKEEVRAYARRLGLVTADKPESQEICFVPDDDYRGFLRRRDPDMFRPGPIVDGGGRALGAHTG